MCGLLIRRRSRFGILVCWFFGLLASLLLRGGLPHFGGIGGVVEGAAAGVGKVEKSHVAYHPARAALEGRLLVAMADRVGEADEGAHRGVVDNSLMAYQTNNLQNPLNPIRQFLRTSRRPGFRIYPHDGLRIGGPQVNPAVGEIQL